MLTDILLLFIVALLAAIFYLLTSEVKKPALEGSDETYKSKPIKPKMENWPTNTRKMVFPKP